MVFAESLSIGQAEHFGGMRQIIIIKRLIIQEDIIGLLMLRVRNGIGRMEMETTWLGILFHYRFDCYTMFVYCREVAYSSGNGSLNIMVSALSTFSPSLLDSTYSNISLTVSLMNNIISHPEFSPCVPGGPPSPPSPALSPP